MTQHQNDTAIKWRNIYPGDVKEKENGKKGYDSKTAKGIEILIP